MRICSVCGSPRLEWDNTCADGGHRSAEIDGFEAFAPDLALAGDGFRPEYFAELAALEAGNFWFRARNDLIAWAMQKYAPQCKNILEIGCGTGFVLSRIGAEFPAARLAGTEIFSAGLAVAAQRVPAATFYQMDARSIPFRSEFDAVGAFDVLEHIESDDGVIAQVDAALAPGGHFFATVPQHPALWSNQDVLAHHVRRYSAQGLRRKIEAAGFDVVRLASFVSLLLPTMLFSRRKMLSDDPETDAMDALRFSKPVNIALEAVMRIERAVIQHGVNLPAGGSLLLVARKPGGS